MTITVTCPSCSTVFPVDPAKVPEGGVNARCSVCSSVFFVDKPEVETASPASPAAPPPTPDVTATDVGEEAAARGAEPLTAEPSTPDLAEPAVPEAGPVEEEAEAPEPTATPEVTRPPEPAAEEEAGEESSPWIDTPSVVGEEDRMVPTLEEEEEAPERFEAPAAEVEVEEDVEEHVEEEAPEPAEAIDEVEVEPAEPVGEPEARETTADDFSPVGLGTTEVVPEEEIAPGDDPSAGVAPETAPDTSEEVQGFTFGKRDPHEKARRLARVLVSDMIMYNPERHARALENDTLEDDFEDEIEKSWKEYVEQVGPEMASDTTYFTDALNDILAKGEPVFDERG